MAAAILLLFNLDVVLEWLLNNSPGLGTCAIFAWIAWSIRGMTSTHTGRVEKVEIKNSDLSIQIAKVDERVTDLSDKVDKRITELAEKVDKRITDLSDKVDARFEKVEDRFEKVDARFEKVDARFEKLEEKVTALHLHVTEVKHDLELKLVHMKHEIVDSTVAQLVEYFEDRPEYLLNKKSQE